MKVQCPLLLTVVIALLALACLMHLREPLLFCKNGYKNKNAKPKDFNIIEVYIF